MSSMWTRSRHWPPQARSFIDFLERCRSHGIWVRVALPSTLGDNAFNGTLNPQLGDYLNECVFAGQRSRLRL